MLCAHMKILCQRRMLNAAKEGKNLNSGRIWGAVGGWRDHTKRSKGHGEKKKKKSWHKVQKKTIKKKIKSEFGQ